MACWRGCRIRSRVLPKKVSSVLPREMHHNDYPRASEIPLDSIDHVRLLYISQLKHQTSPLRHN